MILNPKSTLSCYTNSNAQFLTAGDALNFAGTQYVELAYKSSTIDAIGSKFVSNSYGDVSLYRKNTVTQPNSSFTFSEWDSYPSDYCQNLGTLSTSDLILAGNDIKIYPNPVHDNIFVNGKTEHVKSAKILDFSGKLIYSEQNPFKNKNNISVQNLSTGSYLLKLDEKIFQFIKK
ncbi:T9SS type A sorting domain-containing protein [Chryseobacterium arachidis]|uniref:T9SS type A sorting domain-containing protein n=1 Tax=Chryseobacterium arachidis TaxID=1416778 RepID=UPI00360AA6D3